MKNRLFKPTLTLNKIILSQSWAMTIDAGLALIPKPKKRKLYLFIVFQLLFNILDIAAVLFIGMVGYLTVSGFGAALPSNKINKILEIVRLTNLSFQNQVFYLSLAAVSLFILKTLFSNYISKKTIYFLSDASSQASKILIEKYFSRDTYTVIHSDKNDAIYSLSEGVDTLITKSLAIFSSIFSDAFLLLILLIGLSITDPFFSLFAFMYFSTVFFAVFKIQNKFSRKLGFKLSETRTLIYNKIQEVHENYREILLRGGKSHQIDIIDNLRKTQAQTIAGMSYFQVQSKYIFESSIILGAFVFSAIQFLINDAGKAISILLVFLAAGTRIVPALLRLQNSIVTINSISGQSNSTIKLLQIYNANPKSKTFEIVKNLLTQPEVEISNLTFIYPTNKKATLQNINLSIKAGDFVAIVGPTGSGKSTLLDLCLGFLEPNSGSVKISGIKAADFKNSNPGKLSIIPQRVNIIKSSVRDNITLGYNDKFNDDYIWELLNKVQLDQYVSSLPNKLDSELGEFGSVLSGGQRQRIGIARALYTKPKLIVLDEATSSLDAVTEEYISKMLIDMKREFTIITVAHRLSTVRNADNVVYLESGKILANGTFEFVRNEIKNFDTQAKLMGL